MAIEKQLFEGFAKFFEEPTRVRFRELLESNVGEIDLLDFKEAWPNKTKLAKHILALSNSGGGVLVVGVSEDDGSLMSVGLEEIIDKADLNKQLIPYLPASIEYEILDFSYKEAEYSAIVGKSFQVMLVEYDPKRIPHLSQKSGDGIKDNVIYVRRGTNSTEVNHEELQKLLNQRIETRFSSSKVLELEEHLEQLKTLYAFTRKNKTGVKLNFALETVNALASMMTSEANPYYPSETFDEFVARMIERKKQKIISTMELD